MPLRPPKPFNTSQVRQTHTLLRIVLGTLILAIAIWGAWASIDIGIGWDEEAEHATLAINLAAIQGLLQGSFTAYDALIHYSDRYYGIGFHLPTFAISTILQAGLGLFGVHLQSSPLLLLSHISVWSCFVGSALIVRSILHQITQNTVLANISMLAFLLWPYLLGHGLMNIKDMPFVFAWLLCTYISLPLFEFPTTSTRSRLVALALATAWLASIRIAGVLIVIQYASVFACVWLSTKRYSKERSSLAYYFPIGNALLFSVCFFISLMALYPISWHNPLELWHAIGFMSHHPWEGTTFTAGRFIAPGSKLYFYIPVWLLAKLPLLVIIGLLLSPWALVRAYHDKQHQSAIHFVNPYAIWLGLGLGTSVIIATLIIMRVGLYNELRQTLFLFPLLFIVGIASLAFINAKVCITGLLLTSALFVWDNAALYPYNYSYLNEVARQRPATQYFETDYFGFSAGYSARWLNAHPKYAKGAQDTQKCLYAYPMHLAAYSLDKALYPCLKDSVGNARNVPTDTASLLYVTQRNLMNFAIPAQCTLIHSEERTLPLSKKPLIMGRLFECKIAQ